MYPDTDVLKLLTDRRSPESGRNRQLGAQLAAQRGLIQAENLLVLLLDDTVEWVRYHAFSALVTLDVPQERLLPLAGRPTRDPFFRLRRAAHDYIREVGARLSVPADSKPTAANG